MTAPTLDLPTACTVEELMTDEELALFENPERWHENHEDVMVARGAAFLDRVMPGWQARVEVKTLDIRDTCRCVLGQIWAPYVQEHPGTISGFSAGREAMGFDMVVASYGGCHFTPEEFFGFDTSSITTHSALTAAWRREIEARS